jgi:hypothetical protein
MTESLRSRLSDADGTWRGHQGATESSVQALLRDAPLPLPTLLCDLLRAFDGGEGDLRVPPHWFVLDTTAQIQASFRDHSLAETFPGLLFFGGNGGLERIALDTRGTTAPWPVVTVDPVAGMDSLMTVSPNLEAFVAAIGWDAKE